MDPEPKSRSKRMTAEQVRRLISARVENDSLFTMKFYDKKEAWRTIQEKAGLVEFTAEQVKVKWSNLTAKYKSLITPPTGAATENGEQTADDWEYFADMHNFMSTQHTINPPIVINSCGIVVENSFNIPHGSQNVRDEDLFAPGPSSGSTAGFSNRSPTSTPAQHPVLQPTQSPNSSNFSSPEQTHSTPRQSDSGGLADRFKRKRNRYTQQDMFEFFVAEAKRKKKEGKKFFQLVKCIAQAQNVPVPDLETSSDSDSDE